MATNPFYTKMQGVATRLLSKFGNPEQVQYMELTGGTPDDIFGGTDNAEYTEHKLIGVFTKVSDALLSKANIRAGDRLFISDKTIKPINGYLLIEGERWNITLPDEINPAGQPIVYKTVVRRAEDSLVTRNE